MKLREIIKELQKLQSEKGGGFNISTSTRISELVSSTLTPKQLEKAVKAGGFLGI